MKQLVMTRKHKVLMGSLDRARKPMAVHRQDANIVRDLVVHKLAAYTNDNYTHIMKTSVV